MKARPELVVPTRQGPRARTHRTLSRVCVCPGAHFLSRRPDSLWLSDEAGGRPGPSGRAAAHTPDMSQERPKQTVRAERGRRRTRVPSALAGCPLEGLATPSNGGRRRRAENARALGPRSEWLVLICRIGMPEGFGLQSAVYRGCTTFPVFIPIKFIDFLY